VWNQVQSILHRIQAADDDAPERCLRPRCRSDRDLRELAVDAEDRGLRAR
jgi:hypothetical protein